jgi:outer membrane protein
VALLVAALLSFGAPRVYAQLRVAVVDMQRALLETNDGRRAKNQLKAQFEKLQEDLNRRQNGLKRQKEEIEKQRNVLSAAALQKRMTEYQQAFEGLSKNYLEYQQQLAQREAELTKQILVNLQGVVRQFGNSEGFTLILDQGAVVFSPTHIDLTDRVIQAVQPRAPRGRGPGGGRGDPGGRRHPGPSGGRRASRGGGLHPAPALRVLGSVRVASLDTPPPPLSPRTVCGMSARRSSPT